VSVSVTSEMVVELEVPARAEFISLARMVVATVASCRREMPAERVDDLRLAVSEACTNAIEAHRAAAVDEPVLVRIWEDDDRLDVCVQDHGKGFDPDKLPAHPPVTDPDRLNFERGLGIPLMRSLVDDVVFRPSPSGTQVYITVWAGRRLNRSA
jgi:serine/threonine-protein kinase RsbW